ncbi:hypothetical protein D9619_011071 [Psilocybe cf. subviscida]|uniref:Uncharacterized protein n=1 Tax=Psilocybe cf. subviscida TaxID=2480587 RepID=A0A8H5F007_9AGAR|nr:hypothetical protein D9619_011071 [Psilocybe cf. subviscida]
MSGYLSFWNDNISYALRGCILIELALRRRIALVRDPARKRVPIAERIVEVGHALSSRVFVSVVLVVILGFDGAAGAVPLGVGFQISSTGVS